MKTFLPKALRIGDTIGIISPSSPVAAYPRRLARARSDLRDMGFETVLAPNCLAELGHIAGSPEARAADIHAMFADNDVAAIVATTGGLNANQLVPLLDWDLIAANPKIFMGYSDVSVLLLAIWAQTGLRTVHGPCLLPHFGEVGGLHPYTRLSFLRSLTDVRPPGRLLPSFQRVEERLWWDEQDDRPRTILADPGPRVVQSGVATGPLIAGNMGAMLTLSGTPWWPDLSGHIIFLEEDEAESAGTIERMIAHLAQIGVFETTGGLAFGRFPPEVGLKADDLHAMLTRAGIRRDIPIVAELDFGHVDPMFLLPFGARVELRAEANVVVDLIEAAVA